MSQQIIERAQGCMAGQLSGDSLGSLVEFQTPEQIRARYPDGVRKLTDGGTWDTIAGQPTDDSEMALLLARMLILDGVYDPVAALKQYRYWLESGPFDCGITIASALRGKPNLESQANGAMMRISPLGIFGASFSSDLTKRRARQDCELTHPNAVCVDANALFAMAISYAVKEGPTPEELYTQIRAWAVETEAHPLLMEIIDKASEQLPQDFILKQGWVIIAFQNALYQLLHAHSFEEGVVDTVMRGGDTDTNAAICGALLGAVYGISAVPPQWINALADCRPEEGNRRVKRPRPECFWPVDALNLAEQLVLAGRKSA